MIVLRDTKHLLQNHKFFPFIQYMRMAFQNYIGTQIVFVPYWCFFLLLCNKSDVGMIFKIIIALKIFF